MAQQSFTERFAWLPCRSPQGRLIWLVDVTVYRRSWGIENVPRVHDRHFSWRAFIRVCIALVAITLATATVVGLAKSLALVVLVLVATVALTPLLTGRRL